jgi:hypothetical protein
MSQTVSRGGELTLTCISPRGKPKPKLRWLKDDRNVVVDGIRILLEQRSRLVIKNFKKEDEGSYKCEATNVAGRKLSNPAVITSTGQWNQNHRIETIQTRNRRHAMIRHQNARIQHAYERRLPPLNARHFQYFQGGECL